MCSIRSVSRPVSQSEYLHVGEERRAESSHRVPSRLRGEACRVATNGRPTREIGECFIPLRIEPWVEEA